MTIPGQNCLSVAVHASFIKLWAKRHLGIPRGRALRLRGWQCGAVFSNHPGPEKAFFNGPIAQMWLERTPDKREVTGSTPVRPTA